MEGNPVSQGDWNHRELLALIREVHEIEGLERIRLGSLGRVLLQKSLRKVWQSFLSSVSFPPVFTERL